MNISVVIPLYNEEESLKELNDWIERVMTSGHFSFEVIYIDEDTARYYGQIKAQLKRSGTPIPENDVWISALSIQHALIVATRDHHFDKPKGIKVAYW